MSKNLLLIFAFLLLLSSCASTKKTPSSEIENVKSTNSIADNVIINANKYIGTPYKYGGTSIHGMDCSGLVFTAFLAENIQLPRVSRDMANEGIKIPLKKVQKGDLVFFKTTRNPNINHVGVVSLVENGIIKFIHSTNSRGVIESSMQENYWKNAFVKATKIVY